MRGIALVLVAACAARVQPLQGPGPGSRNVERDRRIAVEQDAKRPDWARAVAKFTWRTRKGRVGTGTAVLVGPRLALTTYHCVEDYGGRGVLRFGFNGMAKSEIARRTVRAVKEGSASGDWVILELNAPLKTIRPLRMAAKPIRNYDQKRMMLAGYSCDRANGRSGLVLTYDDKCRAKKIRTKEARILTDAICYHGASGGPAFVRDKQADRYHWIGLVQGNINESDRKNFTTYVVYQPAYRRALTAALAEEPARIK